MEPSHSLPPDLSANLTKDVGMIKDALSKMRNAPTPEALEGVSRRAILFLSNTLRDWSEQHPCDETKKAYDDAKNSIAKCKDSKSEELERLKPFIPFKPAAPKIDPFQTGPQFNLQDHLVAVQSAQDMDSLHKRVEQAFVAINDHYPSPELRIPREEAKRQIAQVLIEKTEAQLQRHLEEAKNAPDGVEAKWAMRSALDFIRNEREWALECGLPVSKQFESGEKTIMADSRRATLPDPIQNIPATLQKHKALLEGFLNEIQRAGNTDALHTAANRALVFLSISQALAKSSPEAKIAAQEAEKAIDKAVASKLYTILNAGQTSFNKRTGEAVTGYQQYANILNWREGEWNWVSKHQELKETKLLLTSMIPMINKTLAMDIARRFQDHFDSIQELNDTRSYDKVRDAAYNAIQNEYAWVKKNFDVQPWHEELYQNLWDKIQQAAQDKFDELNN